MLKTAKPLTAEPLEIPIGTESLAFLDLSSENSKTIVANAKKVIIDGNQIEEGKITRTPTSITIKVSPALSKYKCIIVLTTENDQIVAVLSYDPALGKLSNTNNDDDDDDDDDDYDHEPRTRRGG
jgi:hypothetical protein